MRIGSALPAFLILILMPFVAAGQNPVVIPSDLGPGCSFTTGQFGFHCIPLYVAYLIQLVFGFAGGFALTQIILAGYQIATGSLTGKDSSGARSRILWAIIGLGVCVFSFLIIDTIIFALAR
jgi:hypothetical protein